jgi:protein-S-isoprenylcysteine O-methyltransferase Ste14
MVVRSTEKETENSKKSDILLTSMVSYVIPFVTTIPNTSWWMGIMVMPLYAYILYFISNPEVYPIYPPNLSNPVVLIKTATAVVTILCLLWSIACLHRKNGDGLVRTGPYRFVRHPQYLSFIILTGLMTLQTAWILQGTNRIGWNSTTGTQIVWIGMLTCYALFAKLEERFLSTQYHEEFGDYRDKIGFFIPGVKNKNDIIEVLSGIIIPYVIFLIILMAVNYSGIRLIGGVGF